MQIVQIYGKIQQLLESNLLDDIRKSKAIYKEKPFYINIAAKEIYDSVNGEEKILVQGVIDLYYIDRNDNIVLVDYKTDYVASEEVLVQKYTKQLNIYRQALEKAMGKNVYKVYIYSFCLGRCVEVKEKVNE